MAKKRAREMLDRSLVIFEKEKEKIKDSVRTAVAPVLVAGTAAAKVEVTEPKKKVSRPSCTVTASAVVQKRVQDREREKWKRFSEPVGLVNRSALVLGGDEKIKGQFNSDVKDIVVRDDEKKGIVSGSLNERGKQE